MVFRHIKISNKWMRILSDVQNESTNSNMGIRLGSALIEKGKIVNKGCNRNDRSQWHGITMPGIHAEMSATKSISPYSRPKNYRRLWSSGESKNKVSYQRGRYEKGSFEKLE